MVRLWFRQGFTPAFRSRPHILEYILQDKNYSDLGGVNLLPLQNGEWEEFSKDSEAVYICTPTPSKAFIGLEHKILWMQLSPALISTLKEVAGRGKSSI